jgi:hypothetical protein
LVTEAGAEDTTDEGSAIPEDGEETIVDTVTEGEGLKLEEEKLLIV